MSIVRIKKRETPYVVIDKTPLEDHGLSWGARGILAYLLSKPDDWVVNVDDLRKAAKSKPKKPGQKVSRAVVQGYMRELKLAGYARLALLRDKDGTLEGKEWQIFEQPIREPDSASLGGNDRQPEGPTVGSTDSRKVQLYTKDPFLLSNEEEISNEFFCEVDTSPASPPPSNRSPKEFKDCKNETVKQDVGKTTPPTPPPPAYSQNDHNPNTNGHTDNNPTKTDIEIARAKMLIEGFREITGKGTQIAEGNIKMIRRLIKKEKPTNNLLLSIFATKYDEWKDDPRMSKYIKLATMTRLEHFQTYKEEAIEKQYYNEETDTFTRQPQSQISNDGSGPVMVF